MPPVSDVRGLMRDRLGLEPAGEPPHLTVSVPRDRWLDAARVLKHAAGCAYFNFLTAIDWKEQGLEVLCRLENLESGFDVTIRTRLGPGETRCSSLTGLYRGADWMERECYDLFGVVFEGHPDLRRILLPQDWEGHPLRKDYAVDTPHAPYR
jgi:NADH-quinone oxidoreductase subunit C